MHLIRMMILTSNIPFWDGFLGNWPKLPPTPPHPLRSAPHSGFTSNFPTPASLPFLSGFHHCPSQVRKGPVRKQIELIASGGQKGLRLNFQIPFWCRWLVAGGRPPAGLVSRLVPGWGSLIITKDLS